MQQKRHSRTFAMFLSLVLGWSAPVFGQSLATLEIAEGTADAAPVVLELAALDELKQVAFTTTTIWTDGTVTFSGVPLKTVLGAHADGDGLLEMVALNDYAVTMPLQDLEEDAPIVATRMNGKPMSVRNKGPYWVVFPYDSDPRYQSETTYARSVWQLHRLNILE